MKPYIIALYPKKEINNAGFRNPVTGDAPREYYVYGPAENHKYGSLHDPSMPLSVFFADDETTAKAHAKHLAIKNPGVSFLVGKTSDVFTTSVPENLPVTHAKFSEKGLLPF